MSRQLEKSAGSFSITVVDFSRHHGDGPARQRLASPILVLVYTFFRKRNRTYVKIKS